MTWRLILRMIDGLVDLVLAAAADSPDPEEARREAQERLLRARYRLAGLDAEQAERQARLDARIPPTRPSGR